MFRRKPHVGRARVLRAEVIDLDAELASPGIPCTMVDGVGSHAPRQIPHAGPPHAPDFAKDKNRGLVEFPSQKVVGETGFEPAISWSRTGTSGIA
jgi:hypothetical protein